MPFVGTFGAGSNKVFGFSRRAELPVVTGGTLTSDATYYYRTFTSNGTLSISKGSLTVDYAVLAGGGGIGGSGGSNKASTGGGDGGSGANIFGTFRGGGGAGDGTPSGNTSAGGGRAGGNGSANFGAGGSAGVFGGTPGNGGSGGSGIVIIRYLRSAVGG